MLNRFAAKSLKLKGMSEEGGVLVQDSFSEGPHALPGWLHKGLESDRRQGMIRQHYYMVPAPP